MSAKAPQTLSFCHMSIPMLLLPPPSDLQEGVCLRCFREALFLMQVDCSTPAPLLWFFNPRNPVFLRSFMNNF